MGHVTGQVAEEQYSSTDNTDAKIVKTFSKEELAQALGEDGYYTLTFSTQADSDLYFRLRGTTVSQVDENGDPLPDADYSGISDNSTRFDTINDSNYASLCFYANPVWVTVSEDGDTPEAPETQTAGMENGSASLDLTKIAGYSAGQFDVDGGVMEIVAYNRENGCAYAVNGKSGKLAVIPMSELKNTGVVSALPGTTFDIRSAVEAMSVGFAYGDMTSVARLSRWKNPGRRPPGRRLCRSRPGGPVLLRQGRLPHAGQGRHRGRTARHGDLCRSEHRPYCGRGRAPAGLRL